MTETKNMANLRDNPDGTCNCRPLVNVCFFADNGKPCNCPCHTPVSEPSLQGKIENFMRSHVSEYSAECGIYEAETAAKAILALVEEHTDRDKEAEVMLNDLPTPTPPPTEWESWESMNGKHLIEDPEKRRLIKSFITQALAEQKARMVEALEGMKTETTWMKDSPYSYKVRAIDEAITIIKALSK